MKKTTTPHRLHIPVRFVDGVFECEFGGSVPVDEGTYADLLVDRTSINDKAFLEALEFKGHYKILDEGTSLLVMVTIKSEAPVPSNLRADVVSYNSFRGRISEKYLEPWNPVTSHFVRVIIGRPNDKQSKQFKTDRGGLWLLTKGVDAVGLSSTTIVLPEAISKSPVASLNHAYTKLSEVLETWRISHTGNIYLRVLYQERNATWYPLDLLRNKALIEQEQEIASAIWKEFLARMTSKGSSG